MKYSLLLADADETLFDFKRSERLAMSQTLRDFDIPATEDMLAVYHHANQEQWKRLERGETTQQRLRTERFEVFLSRADHKRDPAKMSASFIQNLARQGIALKGAVEFCKAVSARMPIIIVTNGIAEVQRGRCERCELRPYFSGMVISEELGVSKPDPLMVERALQLAGVTDRRGVIFMGDSVTADIPCANRAGIDSLLYTGGGEAPEGHGATYVARDYNEALSIILA